MLLAEVPQLTNDGFSVVLTAAPEVEALALALERARVDYLVGQGLLLGGRLEAGPVWSQLFLAFNADAGVVEYSGLSFGFTFTQPGLIVDQSWPAHGEVYVSSDQQYLQPVTIQHAPDTESTLVIWSINAGQEYRAELNFVTPPLPPPIEGEEP